MEIRHGLISADSHVVTERNAFLDRMSKVQFGERIPHVREIETAGQKVDRWVVNERPLRARGVVNSPAVMGDPDRNAYPQKWDEVPGKVFLPLERLKALDADGIDAEVPEWHGYTPYQQHAAFTVPTSVWPAQIVPNLIFSSIAYRFPRLKSVFAETGIGSVSSVQSACDHEWERRQLCRHGLDQRPSELIRRQVYVNFWYEQAGIDLRHAVFAASVISRPGSMR